ncbi:hypothetical protein [Streptomyces sp. NBC_00847]|uniref:hypothetical protein n=1 Tax=Streptomyces sp. NBC_00847 TaxID=2975850 RepID=UPI00225E29E2|nr:hypothetical protein [Streptomyces sp. NBC_00847]MCX4885891.1 hypothetical protein [Streptomyces sp. NBC_00847]
MTNPFFDDDRELSNDELRLTELLRQLLNLSTDEKSAGRIVLLAPDGEFVGDAKLSARDLETVTDALMAVNTYRTDLEEATRPAAPLPVEPLTAGEDDIAAVGEEAEAFLKNGGLY